MDLTRDFAYVIMDSTDQIRSIQMTSDGLPCVTGLEKNFGVSGLPLQISDENGIDRSLEYKVVEYYFEVDSENKVKEKCVCFQDNKCIRESNDTIDTMETAETKEKQLTNFEGYSTETKVVDIALPYCMSAVSGQCASLTSPVSLNISGKSDCNMEPDKVTFNLCSFSSKGCSPVERTKRMEVRVEDFRLANAKKESASTNNSLNVGRQLDNCEMEELTFHSGIGYMEPSNISQSELRYKSLSSESCKSRDDITLRRSCRVRRSSRSYKEVSKNTLRKSTGNCLSDNVAFNLQGNYAAHDEGPSEARSNNVANVDQVGNSDTITVNDCTSDMKSQHVKTRAGRNCNRMQMNGGVRNDTEFRDKSIHDGDENGTERGGRTELIDTEGRNSSSIMQEDVKDGEYEFQKQQETIASMEISVKNIESNFNNLAELFSCGSRESQKRIENMTPSISNVGEKNCTLNGKSCNLSYWKGKGKLDIDSLCQYEDSESQSSYDVLLLKESSTDPDSKAVSDVEVSVGPLPNVNSQSSNFLVNIRDCAKSNDQVVINDTSLLVKRIKELLTNITQLADASTCYLPFPTETVTTSKQGPRIESFVKFEEDKAAALEKELLERSQMLSLVEATLLTRRRRLEQLEDVYRKRHAEIAAERARISLAKLKVSRECQRMKTLKKQKLRINRIRKKTSMTIERNTKRHHSDCPPNRSFKRRSSKCVKGSTDSASQPVPFVFPTPLSVNDLTITAECSVTSLTSAPFNESNSLSSKTEISLVPCDDSNLPSSSLPVDSDGLQSHALASETNWSSSLLLEVETSRSCVPSITKISESVSLADEAIMSSHKHTSATKRSRSSSTENLLLSSPTSNVSSTSNAESSLCLPLPSKPQVHSCSCFSSGSCSPLKYTSNQSLISSPVCIMPSICLVPLSSHILPPASGLPKALEHPDLSISKVSEKRFCSTESQKHITKQNSRVNNRRRRRSRR